MFTPDGIRTFHAWTHESLDVLFAHLATVPPELFTRKIDGFGYPSLRDQLAHLLDCESAWVRRLQRLPPDPWDYTSFGSVADLHAPKQRVMAATLAYLDGLGAEALGETLVLSLPGLDKELSYTPALVLHHVLTHAFHHKGQVVAMCRILGYPAPDTDLCRF